MKHLAGAFRYPISYNCFIELMRYAVVPIFAYLGSGKGECKGISFIDPTLRAGPL
jgi:hypothetical protein